MFNIEIDNWLPRWMNYYSSTSLLKSTYFSILADGYSGLTRKIFDYEGQQSFSSVSQISLAYTAYTSYKKTDQLDITLFTDSDSYSVTRVDTDNMFYMSTSPVYKIQDNGTLILRNLEIREVSVDELVVEDDSIIFKPIQQPYRLGTTIPETYIKLSHQNAIVNTNPTTGILIANVGEEILKCTDVWYLQNLDWERVPANSSLIDYTNGIVTFLKDEPVTIRFSSQSLYTTLSSAYISINSSTRIPIYETRLYNFWDAVGYLADITRYPLETNCSLSSRISNKFSIVGDVTNKGLSFSLCNSLNLVDFVSWCPTGTLDFNTLEISGVVDIYIKEYKQQGYVTETPIPIGNNQYRLQYYPDNIEVFSSELTTISASCSGNILTLLENISTNITVKEKVTYYNTVSSGYITQVIPTKNISASTTYRVFYRLGVNIYTFNSKDFRNQIYTNNQPNITFYNLRNNINNKTNILYDYSIWKNAWFNINQIYTDIDYLPRVLE